MTSAKTSGHVVDYFEKAHRAAAERLVRYAQSERAPSVLRERGPWLKTSEVRGVWFKLIALADDYLSSEIDRAEYTQALLLLAPLTTVPQGNLEVIARYALEFCRCCFIGVGEACRDN
ncbi:MAG: hypothetical protein H6917_06125 [Novosphingobium sp.]|nr:hypothetical protein [Novosphingobium sp.]MCP5401946.1 hypothetical protein [Novosphingobium sp.]